MLQNLFEMLQNLFEMLQNLFVQPLLLRSSYYCINWGSLSKPHTSKTFMKLTIQQTNLK